MDRSSSTRRPLLVTIASALLFSAGLFLIVYTFTGVFAGYGRFYSAVNVLLIIIMFAALSGIWSMEKWGVWLYVAIVVLKLALDILVKAFGWPELLSIIPMIVFLWYFKLMK